MGIFPDDIRSLLGELNDALLLEDAERTEWVICGGTALALLKLVRRTTRDVDVLGTWNAGAIELVAGDFSDRVRRAVRRVAAAHPELQSPGPPWVNLGPRHLVELGLPEGFAKRLSVLPIGPKLTLHLPSRADLVALKLFAAADDLGERQHIHLEDLRAVGATVQELAAAITWIERLPDPHHRIRASLRRVVEDLGHEDLAHYIAHYIIV